MKQALQSVSPLPQEADRHLRVAGQLGDPRSPYLTAEEAAHFLRYRNLPGFYEAIKKLNIPHRVCGRRLLFKAEELDRWMAGEPALRLLQEARSRKGR